MKPTSFRIVPFLALSLVAASLQAHVVINEIFYHAPNDLSELEYIELYNPGKAPVDLSGWAIEKGTEFKFPAGTKIPADGYLVLCRNREEFKKYYAVEPAGVFKKPLSNAGEKLELVDASGKKVDSVRYESRSPWPVSADGESASLERISPESKGNLPENWAASLLSTNRTKPAGSPGKRNAVYSAALPPVISDVKFGKGYVAPGESLTVEATVQSRSPLKTVELRYRVAGVGFENKEVAIPMTKGAATGFKASIPGQQTNQIIRFRIAATDTQGETRVYPAENDLRPAISCLVYARPQLGKIPGAMILHTDAAAAAKAKQDRKRGNRGMMMSEEDQQRWQAFQTLDMGIDLASAWWFLLSPPEATFATRSALQPVFGNQQKQRDALIEKTIEATDLKEKMPGLPKTVKTFGDNLAMAIKPTLPPGQMEAFAKWQETKGAAGMTWGPETMLRRFVPLESFFYRATSGPQITPEQFVKLKEIFVPAMHQRQELTNVIAAAMSGKGDWGKAQEQAQELVGKIRQQAALVLTADQIKEAEQQEMPAFMRMRGGARSSAAAKPGAAFVFIDEKSGEPRLFDFVDVESRNAGFKVHFHKDQPLRGMTGINLIFEYEERFVLAEPLAYELYHRAGNAAPQYDFYRLWVDGDLAGYQLMVEQPNRSFLSRNKLKGDGNLYKILWYEQGVVGQHEKKTNLQSGHEDLVALVNLLEKTKNDEQWAVIKKNFNVDQVLTYFAVNTCLSHWDGFFNNYFTYHDVKGSGKWEMYPWDQDKTWGYYDGIPEGTVFFDLPMTYGMEGDSPPWAKKGEKVRGFRGGHWWREGGYFSRPLLANPDCRTAYLARTRQLLDKVYTQEVFFPVIDKLRDRLREEVGLRAKAAEQDPSEAEQRLDKNIASLKEHLTKRREFLLQQEEIKSAGTSLSAKAN